MGWLWCWLAALFICSRLPSLFPILLAYTLYIHGPGSVAPTNGSWPPLWRGWWLWREVASYFNARLHKTVDLPPTKSYIFGFHPHGVVAFGGFLAFGTHALGFSRLFPGIDVRVLTLTVNFRAPFLREYLLLHGTGSVDRHSCLNMLRHGKSIMIVIGGGKESLYSKPRSAELVLKRRKGFVKIALQTGASLVPVYSFGETDTFRTLNELPENSVLRRAQRWLLKITGTCVVSALEALRSTPFVIFQVCLNAAFWISQGSRCRS
jgi:Diacylglycerol acyltransferase